MSCNADIISNLYAAMAEKNGVVIQRDEIADLDQACLCINNNTRIPSRCGHPFEWTRYATGNEEDTASSGAFRWRDCRWKTLPAGA